MTTSTGYTFDAGSRLTQRTEANGLVSVFSYSGLDQLNGKTLAVGANPAFASWTNTYDPAGNRLGETVTLPTDPIAGPATFTYDTVQQLATATFPTQALASYGYDPAHNRTTVSGTTFAFLPNNAINTEGAIPYAPDADGNQTKDAAGRGFKYDSLNRLELFAATAAGDHPPRPDLAHLPANPRPSDLGRRPLRGPDPHLPDPPRALFHQPRTPPADALQVTAHPTAAWVWRQVIEATPWGQQPRYLIHDRDRVWGADFPIRASRLGIKSIRTPVQAPRANAIAERIVGTSAGSASTM